MEPISVGRVPVKLSSDARRSDSCDNCPNSEGSVPVNWLLDKSSIVMRVKIPTVVGKDPWNRFRAKLSCWSCVMVNNSDGRLPLNSLVAKSSDVRFFNEPT